MRWLRRLAVPVLVVVLAGFASTAQAGSSGLGRPGYTVAVPPPMIGAASRVDLAALLRTGTRTPPASISSRQLARVAPRLAAVAATGNVFNSVTSTSITSKNWSGYVAGDGPYTSVTGTFTVPGLAVTPTETVTSEWVGIDGVGAGTVSPLIQAGVEETYRPSTNLVYTRAWWEILPATATLIPSVPVTPGDSVTVTIGQISGTLWGITVADDTTGQSFTTDQTYTGPGTSAEWIVEAPTDSLTNTEDTLGAYNPPVTFSNLRMGGPETTLEADTMVQGGVAVSVPSALTSTGFTVSYTGSATPAPAPTPVPTPTPAPTVHVATITLGQPFNLVLTGGSPYLSVQWQVSTGGVTWTPLVNVTLDASGDSTYTITPSQTAYYRIYVPSSGQYSSWETEVIVTQPPTPTPIATPIPTPGPTASAPTIFTVTAGEPVTLAQAGPPNTVFALQSSPDEITWTTLAQLPTDASGNATYSFTPIVTAYYRSLFADGPSTAGVGVVLPAVSSGLALAGPPVITWGSTASFTVAIAPGAVRQIDILATRDNIAWSTFASLTTNASGEASFTYRPATNLYYRAVFAGAPDLAAESSAAVRTVVRRIALPRLTDGGRLATGTRGTSVTFTTVLRPDRPELPAPVATFRVYRWSGSAWALYRTVVTTADASGVASLRWTFGAVGSWYVTSMADPTPYNANSVWTAPLRYDVR